ncbi:hypothetical protein ACFL22_00855 [Patescibacteria group bacterium]
MISWASKRKLTYFAVLAILIGALAGVPLFLYLNQPPTCTDGKQNGDELGVDCGGICPQLCAEQMGNILIHWSRSFEVSDGVYDTIALIENPNPKAGLSELIYKFKLYDDNNILVEERFGKTFVNPKEQFIVFESGIHTGQRIPKRTFIEVLEDYIWTKPQIEQSNIPAVSVHNQRMENLETKPRLRASIENDSSFPVYDIEVIAVLFDIDDNAIAVSSTIVDSIQQYDSANITLTWKEPFDTLPVKIDVLPRINLFTIPSF